jgi:nucleotide-binding universal stress UspA family protein
MWEEVMTNDETKPVVVGIDGSDAAVDAAQWATVEAVAHDVPLRLIAVANTPRTLVDWELKGPEAEYGESSLRAASAAVAATGESVKVETELLWGPPSNALIAQSRYAAMICLGTVGIGAISRALLGSTAAAVAERAHCPVALIRPTDGAHGAAENWVAVGIEDRPGNDIAVKVALDEARLRHARLVAVGLGCNTFGVTDPQETERRIETWRQQYPDVHIDVFGARAGLADFLAHNRDELARRYAPAPGALSEGHVHPLAVLDDRDAHEVARIVGPHDHALRKHAQCSVLVAR